MFKSLGSVRFFFVLFLKKNNTRIQIKYKLISKDISNDK